MISEDEKRLVGPADLWDLKRNFQIQFLQKQGLEVHHCLLDFGCGNLRGGLPLITYLQARKYFGFDIRLEVLELGKTYIETEGLAWKEPIIMHNPDGIVHIPEQIFDMVWAFSVLFHIHDEQLQKVLLSIKSHMQEKSVFYFNLNIGQPQNGQWKEFPFVTREWNFYLDQFGQAGFLLTDLGSLSEHDHIHPRLSSEQQQMQRMAKAEIL